MDSAPRDVRSSLDLLRQSLDGAFVARADGLLAYRFALLGRNGWKFGRLRLAGPSVAELRLGDYAATLETSGRRLRMVADGEEVLVGAPKVRSVDELILSSGEQTYEASFSFFRNRASASRPDAGRSSSLAA